MTPVRATNAAAVFENIARLEAELGNRDAARQAVAEGARLMDLAVRDSPPGSFRRGVWSDWRNRSEATVDLVLGDHAGARDRSAKSAQALEALKPEGENQQRVRSSLVAETLATYALAARYLKEHAAAEAAMRRVVALRRDLPRFNIFQEVGLAEDRANHALMLARLGRQAEAREALEPAVAFFAKFPREQHRDLWLAYRLAGVRFAQALAHPAEAVAHLAAAAKLLDDLPPEPRRLASVLQLRNEIAMEQAARR
jgi:tetratricopeptide (TPR) repeat protein